MTKIVLIIPAAGTSTRFKSEIPKQFHVINGKTVLEHTLDAFIGVELEECIIAVNEASEKKVQAISNACAYPITIVRGGATRADSVREAFFSAKPSDVTLIHDAARMCLSKPLIQLIIQASENYDAVIPAIPVTDTIKQVKNDRVVQTLAREELVAVQTPQAFNTNVLRNAYENYYNDAITDEARLIEVAGHSVTIVKGDPENIKITYPIDLESARHFLKR